MARPGLLVWWTIELLEGYLRDKVACLPVLLKRVLQNGDLRPDFVNLEHRLHSISSF